VAGELDRYQVGQAIHADVARVDIHSNVEEAADEEEPLH